MLHVVCIPLTSPHLYFVVIINYAGRFRDEHDVQCEVDALEGSHVHIVSRAIHTRRNRNIHLKYNHAKAKA